MNYADQLKQMSNKELFEKLLDNNQQWLYFSISAALTRVEKIEAELLFRLKQTEQNCGNCKYLTFGTSEQGKNVWNCKNKESFLYDAYVNKTIHCTEWEKDEEGG